MPVSTYQTEGIVMVSVLTLWLPILVAAIIVFIVSSILHMVFSYHNSDFGGVAAEDDVRSALRQFNIPPGDYIIPWAADNKARNSDEFKARADEGPVAYMHVLPNGMGNMTTSLLQWFAYSLIVGIFAAYIAGRALPVGADYLEVFRFAGCTAFVGYSLALLQNSIWYKKSWSATLKSVFDGLIYALCTGGAFGWLWPA
ncbi:MAG: hypothetical protein HKN13_14135 [Rhodothermales bacterium]|nr:hypothetical protein [Rhodothermales bacterium]